MKLKNKRIYFLFTVLIAIIALIFYGYVLIKNQYPINSSESNISQSTSPSINNPNDNLLEINESSGPCPPRNTCHQKTVITQNGKLTLSGATNNEFQLSDVNFNLIKSEIILSNILNKDCPPTIDYLDYSRSFKINFDNKTKQFQYSECKSDLDEIKQVINNVIEWQTDLSN